MHITTRTLRRIVGAALITAVAAVGAVSAMSASAFSTSCEYSEGLPVDTYDTDFGVCVDGVGSVGAATTGGPDAGVFLDAGAAALVGTANVGSQTFYLAGATVGGTSASAFALTGGGAVSAGVTCPQGGAISVTLIGLTPTSSLC